MKASNIFKIFVRSLMIVYLIGFLYSAINKAPTAVDYKAKIKDLQLPESDTASNWIVLDSQLASAHLKKGQEKLKQLDANSIKNEIKIAKSLIADETHSAIYLEIEKLEKAFDHMVVLYKRFEATERKNYKFVRLVSKNNPMILGHIINEDTNSVSIKDLDGFVATVHRKNILSLHDIENREKDRIYTEQLAKVIEDNGKTSSYGLYLTAKWAYENNLAADKVNSILAEATWSDSQILMTIDENESKKILNLAKWANLVGDFADATEKAQLVIKDYPATTQVQEANELLQEITKNMDREKRNRERALQTEKEEQAIASVTPTTNANDINENMEETPTIPEKAPAIVEVPSEEKAAEEPKAKNTLKLKKTTKEDINEKAVIKPEVIKETPEKEEPQVVKENPKKIGSKANGNSQGNPLFDDKHYQEALALVTEGKQFMEKARIIDNPGSKSAQANYKLALAKFEEAVTAMNSISKKYNGQDDFDDLYSQASGMKFFISKSCIRIGR